MVVTFQQVELLTPTSPQAQRSLGQSWIKQVQQQQMSAQQQQVTLSPASTITDFSEAVDDRVASLLQAGSNVTLTYDDASNTLTIASTGGSGGGGTSYTNEEAQDAVGGILTDTASINLTYNDGANTITADAIFGTTAGTVAQGNDARLSDQRVPTDSSVTNTKVASNAAIDWTKISKTGAVPSRRRSGNRSARHKG
jgi:hypothetical protein